MVDKDDFASQRERMVQNQIAGRGIRDERVLEAMRSIPRHAFVPREYRHLAYADGPLPIGAGQTISQPYIVALMAELLGLQGDEKVLEVGTGSGYQAAVLSCLARQVHTIERLASLAEQAERTLQALKIDNVQVHLGDGTLGLIEYAPYRGIVVSAGAPRAPRAMLDQLEDGGALVIPVGKRSGQVLERWQREGDQFKHEDILTVAFVPLVGQAGWKE